MKDKDILELTSMPSIRRWNCGNNNITGSFPRREAWNSVVIIYKLNTIRKNRKVLEKNRNGPQYSEN
jgi:hypothetical protein